MAASEAIALMIEDDIRNSSFDHTLLRYRPSHKQTEVKASVLDVEYKHLLTIFNAWVASLDLSDATKAGHYEMIRRMISKTNPLMDETNWLTSASIAASTFNSRLSYLKRCFVWAISEGITTNNPYATVKSRKAIKKRIKPFTEDEMRRILAEFEQRYPHYVGFVSFMFLTGARTSETIGLQWQHVDFLTGIVEISTSLPIDPTGNGYQRKRKSTKTNNIRHLPMNINLRLLLEKMKPGLPDELVFKSATGLTISAGNFWHDWKRILSALNIEYRKPYVTRHSLASHGIEQGLPLTQIAYLMGHSDITTTLKNYAHLINRPKNLPDINL